MADLCLAVRVQKFLQTDKSFLIAKYLSKEEEKKPENM